jgi:hypothetical protein
MFEYILVEIHMKARCWCLTPVILATWEAEIVRNTVQEQPRKIVLESLISKITRANGLEV